MATVVNKTLVSGQERVLPLTLTFAHVFISSCCDSKGSLALFKYSCEYDCFSSSRNAILFEESKFVDNCEIHISSGNCYGSNEAPHID